MKYERKIVEIYFRKDGKTPAGYVQLRASNQQLRANEQQTKKHLHDLEVFYKANIGREERVVELKMRIKELEDEQNKK